MTAATTRERSGSTSSISSTDSQVALPSFEHIAPPRERTTEENAETTLAVPGVRDVRLKVDAGPGCGGIAWPAGEVSQSLSSFLARSASQRTAGVSAVSRFSDMALSASTEMGRAHCRLHRVHARKLRGRVTDNQVLSRYIAYRHEVDPSKLAGKKVLELGSGTGLVGIVAAMLEPTSEVWVTDQE